MPRLERSVVFILPWIGLVAACGRAPGERIMIVPASVFVEAGGTQQFTFGRRSRAGLNESVAVTYIATGGTITSEGIFTAGNVPGSYRVTASERGGSSAGTAVVTVTPAGTHNYVSLFPLNENPISEGGHWINGGSVGLDWTDVSTKSGLAIGHQNGVEYSDGTALLTWPWGPDQAASAQVYSVRQNDDCYQEVELRLRSSFSAHVATGYEVNFKASQTSSAYLQIVRWNGPPGDFTSISDNRGARFGVKTGDVVTASITGNRIRAYKNGVLMAQARDDVFTAGAPGIGFNLTTTSAGCRGTNGDYGFTSYSATDGPTR